MKVPPKRKGNLWTRTQENLRRRCLNESPSQKEGKCVVGGLVVRAGGASMKVPPKRKGNALSCSTP